MSNQCEISKHIPFENQWWKLEQFGKASHWRCESFGYWFFFEGGLLSLTQPHKASL